METFVFAFLLVLTKQSSQSPVNRFEDDLVDSEKIILNANKRNTPTVKLFMEFVEKKLVEHSQTLEDIIRIVQENEELLERIAEFINSDRMELETPRKEDSKETRRNLEIEDENENIFWRLGRNYTKYGNLFKHLVMNEVNNGQEPKTLVEVDQFPVP